MVKGGVPVITDTRNFIECESLENLHKEGYKLHLVYMFRFIGAQPQKSDEHVQNIHLKLERIATTNTSVINDGVLTDLYKQAHIFANKLEGYLLEV